MGWGNFLSGLMDKLPIAGRVERWKLLIDKYEKEKRELLKGRCDAKKSKRINYLNSELERLYGMCKAKVS